MSYVAEAASGLVDLIAEALEDWKSHHGDFRLIYPKIVSKNYFHHQIEEFTGW